MRHCSDACIRPITVSTENSTSKRKLSYSIQVHALSVPRLRNGPESFFRKSTQARPSALAIQPSPSLSFKADLPNFVCFLPRYLYLVPHGEIESPLPATVLPNF